MFKSERVLSSFGSIVCCSSTFSGLIGESKKSMKRLSSTSFSLGPQRLNSSYDRERLKNLAMSGPEWAREVLKFRLPKILSRKLKIMSSRRSEEIKSKLMLNA